MEKNYKWDPEEYIKHSSAQYNWAKELINKLSLFGSESFLDIGCGDGRITAEIAQMLPNGKVVGIDSSVDMIETALELFPPSKFLNLQFEVMDARKITYFNSFDVVFSNATLHWIQDHSTVVEGIDRALKADGKVLLQMGGKGNGQEIINAADELIKTSKWKNYFSGFVFPYGFYSPAEYEIWLANTNLKPLRLELIPKDMIHKGKEGLANWIKTTWLPFTDNLPEKLKDVFVDELVDNYLYLNPVDDSGNTHVQMVRLEVEAIKVKPDGK